MSKEIIDASGSRATKKDRIKSEALGTVDKGSDNPIFDGLKDGYARDIVFTVLSPTPNLSLMKQYAVPSWLGKVIEIASANNRLPQRSMFNLKIGSNLPEEGFDSIDAFETFILSNCRSK